MDQAEQDVLGSDVVVIEHPRLFLGEDDHSPGTVGEPLKHVAPPANAALDPQTIPAGRGQCGRSRPGFGPAGAAAQSDVREPSGSARTGPGGMLNMSRSAPAIVGPTSSSTGSA